MLKINKFQIAGTVDIGSEGFGKKCKKEKEQSVGSIQKVMSCNSINAG